MHRQAALVAFFLFVISSLACEFGNVSTSGGISVQATVQVLTSTGSIEAGREALERQDFETALRELNGAALVDPNNADVYFWRGNTYYARYEAAFQADDPEADGNDFYRAITDFTKAIELNNSYAEAYSFRGLTYDGLDLPEHALADYNQAIALNPRLPEPYYGRAYLYEQQGKSELAIADYEEYLELGTDEFWLAEAQRRLSALREE